jgi:hypothetical protein
VNTAKKLSLAFLAFASMAVSVNAQSSIMRKIEVVKKHLQAGDFSKEGFCRSIRYSGSGSVENCTTSPKMLSLKLAFASYDLGINARRKVLKELLLGEENLKGVYKGDASNVCRLRLDMKKNKIEQKFDKVSPGIGGGLFGQNLDQTFYLKAKAKQDEYQVTVYAYRKNNNDIISVDVENGRDHIGRDLESVEVQYRLAGDELVINEVTLSKRFTGFGRSSKGYTSCLMN